MASLARGQEPEAGKPTAPSFRVERAAGEIRVDGDLDEPAWEGATLIPLAYEWFPGDNVQPPVRTEALLTYDDHNLYVAFRAFDPDPGKIRAHLMDRDSITTFVQDDHVTLMIDPFNDERRAFQFRINPLGVQADAIFSQVEFVEDFSWDIIWDSAGKITDQGYVVELAIPLNQIRFPGSRGEQTWGFELGRSYPRNIRHRITANPRDRDNNCILCQINKVTGFAGLEPGLDLEFDPTLTVTKTDQRSDFPAGDLESGGEDFDPGLTLRWGITSNLTLNATLNPDFSQVEADVAQLDVNERFALFFPEKRPFFLEGIDFFSTPFDVVFTRTVVDPSAGLKLTGKLDQNALGVFVTEDEVNSLVIPGNQFSRLAFLDDGVRGTVARYRRDMGASSTLGVLFAGREGDSYHNRVGGVDGFFRLSPSDEIRFQLLRSDTLYPEEVALDFAQSLDSFSGDAFGVEYDHQARNWLWSAEYRELDPGFRADSGFIPRVDVETGEAFVMRRFWGEEDDWYTQYNIGLFGFRTEDHTGQLTDQRIDLFGNFSGPFQSFLEVSLERNKQFFDGVLYEDLERVQLFFQIQPGGAAKFTFFGNVGDVIDFNNNQRADLLLLQPTAEVKLGRHVNAQLDHTLQRLNVEGGQLFEANLSQLRLVYNFNVRMFVRGIFQLTDIVRDPDLFGFPVEPETERLFTQLLFSYKLNPQTVLFVGYSDNRLGFQDVDLTQTDRTFFVKLGYAVLL